METQKGSLWCVTLNKSFKPPSDLVNGLVKGIHNGTGLVGHKALGFTGALTYQSYTKDLGESPLFT